MQFHTSSWTTFFILSLFGFDWGWSYWPDESSRFSSRKAYFTSQKQVFKVRIGGEVTFPCIVENLGRDVITWSTTAVTNSLQEGDRLLTAGPVKVYNEARLVHLHNGSQITLRDVQPRDAGEFRCQVNNIKEPLVLAHTLDVLTPPRVVARTPEVTVSVGDEAELACEALGNPQPTISWRRKDRRPLPGRQVGHMLHLLSVGRQEGGIFQCLADNGVSASDGQTVLDEVTLIVNFPPEIELDHQQYYPKMRQDKQEMTCRVLGVPVPDVNWRRGKITLSGHDEKYKMTINTFTGIHTLTLYQVSEEDLGNYTCHAANRLGYSEQTITLSGKPLQPVILPGSLENRRDYKLKWLIESAFPIRGHNIYYSIHTPGSSGLDCEASSEDCVMLRMEGDAPHIRRRGSGDFNIKREMEVVLRELKPEAKYLLQVQTINDFGSSEWSQIYKFDTVPEPVSPLAPWSPFSSSSSSSTSLSSISPLTLSIYISPLHITSSIPIMLILKTFMTNLF